MQAAFTAPDELKIEALRILRGEGTAAEAAPPPRPFEPYFTLSQAARQLGFSERSLSRWHVPGHDLGGHRRYRLSEVLDYLASQDFQRRSAALRAERREETLAREAPVRPRSVNQA